VFGKELSKYPDIFADAIALLNPELPAIMCEQWPEALEAALESRKQGQTLDI
jgi:hypothetical protein